MIILYLILSAWLGYAFWFVYDTRNDHYPPGGRAWWTPLFMFVMGLFAFVMLIGEHVKEAWRRARCAIRDRDAKYRDKH